MGRWLAVMGLIVSCTLGAVVAPTLSAVAAAEASSAKPAVCPVCAVREGSTHAEDVVAVVVHEGVEYGFCNDACAAEFRTDPVAYLPPVLPRPAPWAEMKLVDLAGQSVTPARFAGRVALVDFWATWCVPCRKSMPELQALHARYADRGFTVLGVSIDEDGPKAVTKFVREKKIGYPIAIDAADSSGTALWERFRVKAVPAAFLVDGEGRIVAQWTGRAPSAAEVEEKVVALLGPRPE